MKEQVEIFEWAGQRYRVTVYEDGSLSTHLEVSDPDGRPYWASLSGESNLRHVLVAAVCGYRAPREEQE